MCPATAGVCSCINVSSTQISLRRPGIPSVYIVRRPWVGECIMTSSVEKASCNVQAAWLMCKPVVQQRQDGQGQCLWVRMVKDNVFGSGSGYKLLLPRVEKNTAGETVC